MSGLTREGTAEPVSRDQVLRQARTGTGKFIFPSTGDHQQDGQPYKVNPNYNMLNVLTIAENRIGTAPRDLNHA